MSERPVKVTIGPLTSEQIAQIRAVVKQACADAREFAQTLAREDAR